MKALLEQGKIVHATNAITGGTIFTTLMGVIPEITGTILAIATTTISILLYRKNSKKIDAQTRLAITRERETSLEIELTEIKLNKKRRKGDK